MHLAEVLFLQLGVRSAAPLPRNAEDGSLGEGLAG